MTHVRLASRAAVAAPVLSAGVLVGAVAADPQQAASAVAGAQSVSASAPASPAQGTQARETQPYARAMNAAAKVTDPEQKIAAFRKVIADFPKTPAAGDYPGAPRLRISTWRPPSPKRTSSINSLIR
jgi:hypothetical protein